MNVAGTWVTEYLPEKKVLRSTKVEEFAGGFFTTLNSLTGNPEPAPECARVLPDGALAPQPETDTNQFVEAGTTELGPIAGTSVLPIGVTH